MYEPSKVNEHKEMSAQAVYRKLAVTVREDEGRPGQIHGQAPAGIVSQKTYVPEDSPQFCVLVISSINTCQDR